jgi:hypothetical protein
VAPWHSNPQAPTRTGKFLDRETTDGQLLAKKAGGARTRREVEVALERPADIGEQEIDGVERARSEASTPGDCGHRHNHNVPITSVMTVSGAPTLK